MKKIILIAVIIVLYSCKTSAPVAKYVTISEKEVSNIKKNRAYDLGKRLLESCNTSRFKQFTTKEATEKVINNATRDKISETCHKINHRNGKFIDLKLIEVAYDAKTDEYFFRYNIDYEKKYFKRELRVTVNAEDKVSSITTKELPTVLE
jgi:predicted Holliday junction resolvase-like endonuclease